jgi:hypothetical protein
MKGKKLFIPVFAVMMIGAGFLSVTVFADSKSKPENVPTVINLIRISFPGGGAASYEVDPRDSSIRNFFRADGAPINPLARPHWLKANKEWVGIGCFTDPQCQPSYVAIQVREGTPIEYWSWTPPNNYYCIGAYDAACEPARWYQPCRDNYPTNYPTCSD